jgi:hypothetical protein
MKQPSGQECQDAESGDANNDFLQKYKAD